MPYKFVEDVAIADVAFEASGKSLDELFKSCAEALINVQVRNMEKIEPDKKFEIDVTSDKVDMLLFNFLTKLVIVKDTDQLIFGDFDLNVTGEGDKWRVKCTARGEKINPDKHEMIVDVKAVTLHMFEVKKTGSGWAAFVVLDI